MRTSIHFACLAALFCLVGTGARAEGLDDLTLDENGVAQISSATDFLNFAIAVNNGNQGLNAVLTQDIDLGTDEEGAEAGIMSELTMVGGILTNATDMVEGRSPNKYTGTFDGQLHKITYVKTKADYPSWGLFGLLEGTICNLRLKGTISTGKNYNAGLVNTINGGTVENCYVDVDFTNGATHGGICRVGKSAKGSLIKGCVFAGTLEGTGGNSNGFIYGEGTNNVIENSLLLSFGSEGSGSYKFYRNRGTCKNCYYLDTIGTGNDNPGSEAVTADELKSGSICYILNSGATDAPAWRQTLGEDDLPVLDATHKTVYSVGYYKCDGVTPVDGADITYTNEGSGKVVEEHQFEDGLCPVCMTIDPTYLVDGVFQISSAGSFRSFALIVNSGKTQLDAQLTEDIDLGGVEDIPMVGFTANSGALVSTNGAYAGTFDGGFHTISYNKVAESSIWGLFGCLSGTIRNLKLSGSLVTEFPYMGTLVNTLHGGTISNCYNEVDIVDTAGAGFHGGFARVTTGAGGRITGCWYAGNIIGDAAKACAGIICFSEKAARISDVLFTGQLNVDLNDGRSSVISRGTPTFTGCYYVQSTEASAPAGVAQITDEEISNGFACFALNAGNTLIPAWHQTLGSEPFPVLGPTGDVVYAFDNVFANITDEASLQAFAQAIIASEEAFCSDRIAQAVLLDSLMSESQKLAACPDLDSLMAFGTKYILPLKARVLSSEAAYNAYKTKTDEAKTYIDERPEIQNVVRDELYDYLTEYAEPGETYAQGSATFIMENHTLNEQQLSDEIAYLDEMMAKMLSYDPTPGMEITRLFTNPDFEKGFEGWEGQLATGQGTAAPGMVHAAECWNRTMDMHQTLTGLKNGIYELQVNGAVSPSPRDDVRNTNYVAMLYLNDLQNYFQANIEDMMLLADAVDGENCNLTGTNPDLEVFDENFELEGYVMNRLESASIAFHAGRYPNSILVNVTDGSLTVGFRMPGSGSQPEWLGFGNIRVYYRGTIDEAAEALDNVLASQAARANTILNVYVPGATAEYPNFSQALKDDLKKALDDIATTTEPAAKYQLIERFSDLFQQVYDCKQVYRSLIRQSEMLVDFYMALTNILDDTQLAEIINLYDQLNEAYNNGTMTAEEAAEDHLKTFSWMPEIVDGAYQIKTDLDFLLFATAVNSLDAAANADLRADINLDQVIDQFQMVGGTPYDVYVTNGSYNGTFDGHGHTITYHKTATSDCWGLFGCLKGTVCNLRVSGSITTDFRFMASLVNTFDGGVMRNCVSDVDIITTSGTGFHGGLARVPLNNGMKRGGKIIDCVYAGTMSGETATKCAGICCWVEYGMEITNCLFAGSLDINLAGNGSYIIARNPGGATFTNCYYLNATGVVNANTAQVTVEQMANGELRDMLNTDPEHPVWTQPEGSAYPVPFEQATGIAIATTDNGQQSTDAIYDLQGRRVLKATKGIYIINGKKVLK